MESKIIVKPVKTWSDGRTCTEFKVECFAGGDVIVRALDPISDTFTLHHHLTARQIKNLVKLANAQRLLIEEYQIQDMKRIQALRLSNSTATRLGNLPAKIK